MLGRQTGGAHPATPSSALINQTVTRVLAGVREKLQPLLERQWSPFDRP